MCTKTSPVVVPASPKMPSMRAIGIRTIWNGMKQDKSSMPKKMRSPESAIW